MFHVKKRNPLKKAIKIPATRRQWAAQINAAWRKSVAAIFETGRILIAAKASLEHGQWETMCANDLKFNPRVAQMLMAIEHDRRLAKPKIFSLLPPAYTTIYQISKLSDEELEARAADGTIGPDMLGREVVHGARAVMASREHPADDLDFAPTPPWATRALMERVLPQIPEIDFAIREQKCWEPACGEGHMAEVLREYFRFVHASDIHDYGHGDVVDFLSDDGKTVMPMDWVITNPPFQDKAEAFTLRALDLAGVGVAIFAQLRWLETIGRYEHIFRDQPPTLLAFFVERVEICMGRWEPEGGTATAYMWLVWVKDRAPQAPLWIPPGCREALTRPDDEKRFTAHPVMRRKSFGRARPSRGARSS
jgi:hypothetical protein